MEQQKQTDHRWSSRQPLELDVAVHSDSKLAPIHFTSRNISLGGMFVETKAMILPLKAFVVLAFTLRAGKETTHHRMPALVVRTSKDGAALMFQDFDVSTVRPLREMLYP